MSPATRDTPAADPDAANELRILQLSSDWKWTGPAEPMLQLALALRERGHALALACPPPPDPTDRSLAGEAEAAGLAPALELARGRGARPLGGRAEVARLAAFLEREDIGLVHCWHSRDHVLALRAARSRRRAGRTHVVRTWRNADAIPATPWNRWLFGPGTDGLFCVSPESASRQRRLRGARPLRGWFGAIDLERFAPRPPDAGTRAALGLGQEHAVIGVVARVQAHRRFDLLLEAARRLFAREPAARLLIVGRGTRRAELAEIPARELGIADRVVFAGYRAGDYVDVLRAMDVITFLVPGSDGSCRALLEAAACGIPALASRRGALPEIVADGESGILVDEDAGALAGAWRSLLRHPERRAAMGAAARKRAEALFAPRRLADEVLALYAEVCARSGASSR